MAKVKIHPNDPTMIMFWDVATQSPNAFWVRSSHPCWSWNEDFEKPTVSPSILSESECHVCPDRTHIKPYRNHVFIVDGKIQYLSDCTHQLAGQTVDMVDFPEDW